MIEVEIKVKILDSDKIKNEFIRKKGTYKCSLVHEDTYFKMPEGLRDFQETDEALRIRKSTEFNKYDENTKQQVRYFLTYKGPKINLYTKTRKEIESLIKEGDKVFEIFKLLGFREVYTVKKEREMYLFEYKHSEIEALIDYIPILDTYFLEVESQVESPNDSEEIQDLLFNFLAELGIKKEQSIRKSYLELVMEHLEHE
ncbi:MAG: class IV adenylate cyclase [Promethearchaeota archaeon]